MAIAINAKDLYQEFKDVTSGVIKKNKDSSVISILTKTVKSLETVLKALDSFLKSKNIDVSRAYEYSKEKGKNLVEQAKSLYTDVNDKGVKTTVSDIGSKIKDKFKRFTEGDRGPPDQDNNSDTSDSGLLNKAKALATVAQDKVKTKAPALISKLGDIASAAKQKVSGKPTDTLSNTKSWAEKREERERKREAEIQAEKDAVKDRANKGKKDGWLGKILSGLMTLGGFVVKGIGSAIKFLGGFLFNGISKTLLRLVPMLSSGIAGSMSSILGGLFKGGGRLLGSGITALGGKAVAGLVKAAPLIKAGLGVAARGIGMVASGPVGWAIAIGTAVYGGYKLYKYLTRNSVGKDVYGKMTLLRLHMYGFNDSHKSYYSKIFDLEMLLKDFTTFSNNQAVVKNIDAETAKKIHPLFNIDESDKSQMAIFRTWFNKRFIPSYTAYVSALWSVKQEIFLDDIDKLKQKDLEAFLSNLRMPTSSFNFNTSPVKELAATPLATPDEVNVIFSAFSLMVKDGSVENKSEIEKAADQKRELEAKEKAKATKDAETAAKENKIATELANTPGPRTAKTAPIPGSQANAANNAIVDPNQEGEPKEPPAPQPSSSSVGDVAAKASGKLVKAQGDLVPGSTTLEGIASRIDKSKILGIEPNILQHFTGMAKEYKDLTGKSIPVGEALRSREDQEKLFKQKGGKGVAKPGTSLHEFGLALDTGSAVNDELDKLGLLRKYGFTRPIGGEKWHLEPIGVSLDPARAKKDPSFRNMAILNSPGRGGGGFGAEQGTPLGKRNISLQKTIFEETKSEVAQLPKTAQESDAVKLTKGSETPARPAPQAANTTTAAQAPSNQSATTPTQSASARTTKQPDNLAELNPDQEGEKAPPKPTQASIVRTNATIGSMVASNPTTDKTLTGQPKPVEVNQSKTEVPGIGGNMNIANTKQNLDPVTAIKQASKMVGVSSDTLLTTAKIESSLNPTAKAKTSSASGLFQLIDSTWNYLVDKYGKKYGITRSSDRFNPLNNALMGGEYIKENLNGVKNVVNQGVPEDTAAYLAHFLGPGGARKFFNTLFKNPDAPSTEAATPQAAAANKSIFQGRTVKGVLDLMENKISKARGSATTAYNPKLPEKSSTGSQSSYAASVQPSAEPLQTSSAVYNRSTTSGSSPIRNALYTPSNASNPTSTTVGRSQMNLFSNSAPTPSTIPTAQSQTNALNSGNVENLLTQQLNALNTIAQTLTKMSGGFDVNKITEAISSGMNKQTSGAITSVKDTASDIVKQTQTGINNAKSVATSVVDLTRKSLRT